MILKIPSKSFRDPRFNLICEKYFLKIGSFLRQITEGENTHDIKRDVPLLCNILGYLFSKEKPDDMNHAITNYTTNRTAS